MSRAGSTVRYLRSIFVPVDETWFLLYEAPSAAAVVEAGARAGISIERVVDAVVTEVPGGRREEAQAGWQS